MVILPSFAADAFELLKGKEPYPARRQDTALPTSTVRTALNGFLVQDKDSTIEGIDEMECVTNLNSDDTAKSDMIFAMKIAKHTKSNTIVFAKGGQLIASGTTSFKSRCPKTGGGKANNLGLSLEGRLWLRMRSSHSLIV